MRNFEIPNDETIAAFAELDNGGGEWFNGSTEDYIAKLSENMKCFVRAWDPDFTKVTPEEAKRIARAEASGFVDESEIDWNHIGTD